MINIVKRVANGVLLITGAFLAHPPNEWTQETRVALQSDRITARIKTLCKKPDFCQINLNLEIGFNLHSFANISPTTHGQHLRQELCNS
jgi:hypothetical protein